MKILVNYLKTLLRLQEWAAEEELSANEVILFQAVLRCLNDRYWPDGPVGLTNNQILVYTTFSGSQRDRTLRETRKRLAARGILTFSPGQPCRNGQEAAKAVYQIHLEVMDGHSPEEDPYSEEYVGHSPEEDHPDDGSMVASVVGSAVPSVVKKYHGGHHSIENVNSNTELNYDNTVLISSKTRAREGGLKLAEMGPASGFFDPANPGKPFDNGWKLSERARKSIALQMVNHAAESGMDMTPRAWEHGIEGNDIVDVLIRAMRAGFNPAELVQAGEMAEGVDEWSVEIKKRCLSDFGTDNFPGEWGEVIEN
jgi:hypothetical protein